MFSWQEFLNQHHIPHWTSGPSVSRGNINIDCPWGCSQGKFKMGLHDTKGYACWVNGQHRGKAPHRIVMQLLGCSYATAVNIVGHKPPPDQMDDVVRALSEAHEKVNEATVEPLKLPKAFKSITANGLYSRFWHYLRGRGFSDPGRIVERYNLRGCLVGQFANRLIIPIYLHGKLVGWTGRSLFKDADLRYLSLSHRPESIQDDNLKPAPIDIKHTLLLYDRAYKRGGRLLFVVEGPIDAIKLDYYASPDDCHAVALYGTNCSDQQAYLLESLSPRYERTILLLDPGALQQQWSIQSKYPFLGLDQGIFPEEWEDPGALTKKQVRQLIRLQESS